jgi:L-fucose isomerase-like protein
VDISRLQPVLWMSSVSEYHMIQPRQQRPIPKLGLVLNSIEVFDPVSKDQSETALRKYFGQLLESKQIDSDSIITERIFGPHEALAVADRLAAAQVDLVVIANIAFPNGQVFLTLATHPNLAQTPLAVIAEPEPDTPEWATNAWCGVIMNNYVAHQIGRPILTLPGPFAAQSFQAQFSKLLRVAGTIRFLRRDFLCRFGEAPGGFHSASGSQMAFARVFGTRVDTLDLTAVMETFRTGKAKGYRGEEAFSEDDIQQTVAQITDGREIQVDADMVKRGARLYHTYRAIIRANGYTSAAYRCWPEQNESYIGVSSCLAIGLLLANGEITGAACESDWPTAVVQSIGTLLAGRPAACLDWVNYTGGSEIVQLGHCGVGICGSMAEGKCHGASCDTIAVHPVIRLGGGTMGPVHIGQYEFGPKTGLCLAQDRDGHFKLLVFRGTSSPETARGLAYVAADMAVSDYQRLNQLVLEGGFPHHLAVALADISEEAKMLCTFLGIEWVSPHEPSTAPASRNGPSDYRALNFEPSTLNFKR